MQIVLSSWYTERCKRLAEIWNSLSYENDRAYPFVWDAEAVALFLTHHAITDELVRQGLFTLD